MMSNLMFFTITLAVLIALPLNAAESQQQPALTPDSSGQIGPTLNDDIESTDALDEQTSELPSKQSSKPIPQGGKLRERAIGDGIVMIQPAEDIEVNKELLFPVDI